MNVTSEFLLRATERACGLQRKLGAHQDPSRGSALFGLYLNENGIGPYAWWREENGGELLSEHATLEEAEKAKVFLILQAAMELMAAEASATAELGAPVKFADLSRWQEGRAAAAFALAGEQGGRGMVPDPWASNPHWFCSAGHVSTNFVERGSGTWLRTGCPRCGGPVLLGPPMTESQFAAEVNGCRGAEPVQQPIEA